MSPLFSDIVPNWFDGTRLMVIRIILVLVLTCCSVSSALSRTQDSQEASGRSGSKIILGSPEAEMLARRDLKAAEKDYRDNLERAREAAQLSTEIRDTFAHSKAFSRIEHRKLDRLEKITRRIRNEAGGSDDEITVEDLPTQLEPALVRLADVSETLRKRVEKTPRQVISASVIERANEALEIIRVVRAFIR